MTKEELTNAISVFESSHPHSVFDYLNLFAVVSRAYRQGVGMVGTEIKDCIEDALNRVHH